MLPAFEEFLWGCTSTVGQAGPCQPEISQVIGICPTVFDFRVPPLGLSDGAEWVWNAWIRMVRDSCDLLLAALGPNCIRGSPFFLMGGFGFFVVENSDGEVLSVPLGRDTGLIIARRVDTWVDPYDEQVGFVVLNCAIALTVSCCLRQPRIAFEATHSFSKISRTALAAVFCDLGINEAHLG
ncbi:hypothetical protein [Gimesia sp.]|uniref:hypothetical protein n=1 Tax=Gimesia sp. TaxID=2024833 RepID=UPI003A91B855